MMEDESSEFSYQFERNQLDNFAENPFLLQAQQIAFQENFFPSKIQKEYKIPASISHLPAQDMLQITHQNKLQLLMKKKVRTGIQIMFGLSKESNENGFLQDIDTKIFEDSSYLIDLNKLFKEECSHQTHRNSSIEELTNKMADIQKKAFSSVSMNKTIGKAFQEHFENFVYLQNESDYLKKFELSFTRLLNDNHKLKHTGINLILAIYEFWMRMFRDFIRQIWKHSQKYSMDLIRQRQQSEKVYSNKSSTSQSQLGEKIQRDKRKPWKKDQIESLEKIINSNAIFNQARLNKLSQQLGRTPSSISSKIQKMTKNKRNYHEQDIQEQPISLDKKIEFVLKNHSEGLCKEDVVKKLTEYYDMGYQQNWKKSVSQLLSSKKQISKTKGAYSLTSPNLLKNMVSSNTMKDKLINCFFHIENYEADLKTLTDIYVQLYGEQQEIAPTDKQKFKVQFYIIQTLQMSISKALCRYDIFNKDKSKTVYKLAEVKPTQNMDIEDFLL